MISAANSDEIIALICTVLPKMFDPQLNSMEEHAGSHSINTRKLDVWRFLRWFFCWFFRWSLHGKTVIGHPADWTMCVVITLQSNVCHFWCIHHMANRKKRRSVWTMAIMVLLLGNDCRMLSHSNGGRNCWCAPFLLQMHVKLQKTWQDVG